MPSKMLAAVLKRTGQPRKPKASPGREADLLKKNLYAATTGTGFTERTPAGGRPTDRGGGYRKWPKPGSLEPKPNE